MGNQMNIPQLRFPEFKGEWEKKKLGEVAEFKVTNSFSRENLNYENGYVKNIHYGDIHTKFQTLFDITKEEVPFVNEEMNVKRILEDFYCKEGDIIFADASEDLNDVGKSVEIVNLNNEKLISGLHTLLARPNDNTFSLGFNGHLFKSNIVRQQIQKEAQGSKVLGISITRIKGINLSFPTLPEQTKIANFFTAIDAKLQNLKKKKIFLEAYKKGVMQKIFSQELRFKNKNGKAFADWEVKKLGEVAEIKRGAASQHLTYVNNEKDGIRFLRINDFLSNEPVFVKNTLDMKRFTVKTNDLLMAGTGATAGIVFVVPEKFNNLTYSYNAPRIRVENAYYLFVYHYLTSDIILKQQKSLFVGNAQPFLDTDVMRSFKINLPSLPEQTAIANFLSSIDEKINKTNNQITHAEQWKKGLLQRMFV
jgi:type I restriction enzyme, S subunit